MVSQSTQKLPSTVLHDHRWCPCYVTAPTSFYTLAVYVPRMDSAIGIAARWRHGLVRARARGRVKCPCLWVIETTGAVMRMKTSAAVIHLEWYPWPRRVFQRWPILVDATIRKLREWSLIQPRPWGRVASDEVWGEAVALAESNKSTYWSRR